jgi:hypothetical protein
MRKHQTAAVWAAAALTLSLALLSLAGAVVAAPSKAAPTNTSAPTVSGTPAVGSTLSLSTGSWSGNGVKFSYSWNRCDSSGGNCVAVDGAVDTTYTVASADVGATIRGTVSATSPFGSSAATSAATSVVAAPPTSTGPAPSPTPPPPSPPANTAPPAISGTPVVGQALTASTGSWSGSPTSYAYQWFYCSSPGVGCVAISGATTSSYTPVVYDVGGVDMVQVTASNTAGSGVASSSPTGVVQTSSTTTGGTTGGTTTSSGAYFADDFESGLGQWSEEGASSQFTLVSGWSGQGALLTDSSSSSGPNSSSQMASLYLNPGAKAAASAGNDTWYHVKVMFPSDYQPTTGQWNWIVEWHDDTTTTNVCGLSCVSIGMGVYTDYPVTTGYGQNPRLALRISGGTTTNIVQKTFEMPSNSLLRNHWYDLMFHIVWSANASVGRVEWWVDGQQQGSTYASTLYTLPDGSTSTNGFGLYNYRLSATWQASVGFDHVRIGPTQASVQ